jgi:hypothetical protein
VEAEIFDFIGLRKLNIIDFNWWAGHTPCSECDVGRLGLTLFQICKLQIEMDCLRGHAEHDRVKEDVKVMSLCLAN